MKIPKVFFLTLIAPLLFFSVGQAAELPDHATSRVQRIVQARLSAPASTGLVVRGEPLYAAPAVADFYRGRLFYPAWSRGGRPDPAVYELVAEIRRTAAEGLVPEHYHLPAIEALLAEFGWWPGGERPTAVLVDLDLLLTDAFLVLGSHYLSGRINPVTVDPEWHAKRREGDPVQILERALREGEGAASLRQLLPVRTEYAGLRSALARYRELEAAGGWTAVPPGPTLRRGDAGPRVRALRARLAVTGELAGAGKSDLFDEALEEAVRHFQATNGLESDGAVGRGTLAALNVSAAQRVRQIEVNLERWRWLPQNLGERYLLVNIAGFQLNVVERSEGVLDMRVVVGRTARRTPVFSDRMTYLVFNPYWEIPVLIIVEDIVPQVRRDPAYLAKMGIKVLQGWGANAREIDPATVNWATDWQKSGPKQFPYRLRQDPGPMNALGRIKFMLPNDHDVYLHDTPARNLFHKEARTFSSGCIRIEKPLELAEYLLQNTPLATREALEEALARDQNRIVYLPSSLPVHLLYWTSWVDAEGEIHFRPDIYGRDETLRLALDQPPPAADRLAFTPGVRTTTLSGI